MTEQFSYERSMADELVKRLYEPRRFIQVIFGPRQTGKTTLAAQVAKRCQLPYIHVTADVPGLRDLQWIAQQWETARALVKTSRSSSLLILDEVQKIPHWSEMVKMLWDEDSLSGTPVKVVVLGSAPLLLQRGVSESLAGRFETLHLTHWSFNEMRAAFGFSFDQYLSFGGYPGAVPLINDVERWMDYINNSLIEPTISRDILLLTQVDKPALLRRLFELGCAYSGQIVSYTKMVGQLQDAGNTTTLAHYLDLLEKAGMLTGLQKYAGQKTRRRASQPKLQVLNTALMTAVWNLGVDEAQNNSEFKERLTESAVGAHLINGATGKRIKTFYWRENNREVDFVVEKGSTLTAIEVKSGHRKDSLLGMDAFSKKFNPNRKLLIGTGGIQIEQFLSQPVEHWLT